MSKLPTVLKYWLPVVIWMSLIFVGSGNALSSKQTSRFLGPFIHWLFPALPDDEVREIVTVIRKGGHVFEYAVLAVLVWWARRHPVWSKARPWSWRDAGLALAFAALYAVTDEVHQSFVPSRQGSPWDVLVDSLGAAVALVFVWLVGRRLKYW